MVFRIMIMQGGGRDVKKIAGLFNAPQHPYSPQKQPLLEFVPSKIQNFDVILVLFQYGL